MWNSNWIFIHRLLSREWLNLFMTKILFWLCLFFRCKKDNSRKRKSDKINSDKEEWEHFINQHQLEVWRRPIDTTGLYEYKGKNCNQTYKCKLLTIPLVWIKELFSPRNCRQSIQMYMYVLREVHEIPLYRLCGLYGVHENFIISSFVGLGTSGDPMNLSMYLMGIKGAHFNFKHKNVFT